MKHILYGGQTVPSWYVVDKVFTSDATAYGKNELLKPEEDNVALGRYVLVNYCDTCFTDDKKLELIANIDTYNNPPITDEDKWKISYLRDNESVKNPRSFDRMIFQKTCINGQLIYREISYLVAVIMNEGDNNTDISQIIGGAQHYVTLKDVEDWIEGPEIHTGTYTAMKKYADSVLLPIQTWIAQNDTNNDGVIDGLVVLANDLTQTQQALTQQISATEEALRKDLDTRLQIDDIQAGENITLIKEGDVITINSTASSEGGSDIGQPGVAIGAERFNDYNTNHVQAYSQYSTARGTAHSNGTPSFAGCIGTRIRDLDLTNLKYSVKSGSFNGQIGDSFSLYTQNYGMFINAGVITNIIETEAICDIYVDQMPDKYATVVEGKPDYIFIIDRPNAGTEMDLGEGASVEGLGTRAVQQGAHAEGALTKAIGRYSHAEGHMTEADGQAVHAEGYRTVARGAYSHTEGYGAKALAEEAHAEGRYVQATGIGAHAEGEETKASGRTAHAEGYFSIASGVISHSEGAQTQAKGQYAHAENHGTVAEGTASHAEGWNTQALHTGAHAEGEKTTAFGKSSHASGYSYKSLIGASHSSYKDEDDNVIVLDADSPIEDIEQVWLKTGKDSAFNASVGNYSHTEGINTLATGAGAHVEGRGTLAKGKYAHAEGTVAKAYGEASHAEGQQTQAKGDYAHAEGSQTEANGAKSHAGGRLSKANGENSFAHGQTIQATETNQFVVGQYNDIYDTDFANALFVVGTGGRNSANQIVSANGFMVLKDGSVIIKKTPTTSNEATNKNYVDNQITLQIGNINALLETI